MKKIAIFNHKGGVCKTTTAFNVGWMLAKKGKRVLLVDADSQCNLTLYSIGYKSFETFYERESKNNIKDALEPAFKSKPRLIEPVECLEIERNKNLFLIPGHLDLSENEVQLGLSFQLTEAMGALENLPGSFNYLFEKTAKKYEIDYMIIDMNPSLSAINQDLLISSDYFMVPTSPDLFSYMAIKSISRNLPTWERWAKRARIVFQDAEYPLPTSTPKFLGYTINDFNISDGFPSKAFAKMMNRIARIVQEQLVPNLQNEGMLLNPNLYESAAAINGQLRKQRPIDKYCIAEISNFKELIAMSNELSIPIFELFSVRGKNRRQSIALGWFNRLYEVIAEKIIILTQDA